jgi:hypothetical protein
MGYGGIILIPRSPHWWITMRRRRKRRRMRSLYITDNSVSQFAFLLSSPLWDS